MSHSLAKHRDLEIVQSFGGPLIYHADGRCCGMGDGVLSRTAAVRMLHDNYQYNELLAAYFPEISIDTGASE